MKQYLIPGLAVFLVGLVILAGNTHRFLPAGVDPCQQDMSHEGYVNQLPMFHCIGHTEFEAAPAQQGLEAVEKWDHRHPWMTMEWHLEHGFSQAQARRLLGRAPAEEPLAEPVQSLVSAGIEDFRLLEGDDWSGSLTYLDYGSGERVSIPVELKVQVIDDTSLEYAIRYPDEEEHNASAQLRITGEGSFIDGQEVVSRKWAMDGPLTLTTQGRGYDDNREVDIRFIYVISENEFRMLKDVRFSPDESYINRNEYAFTR